MSVDLAAMVVTPSVIGPVLAGMGAASAAAIAAALGVPAISNRLMPMPKETRLADFIPFESMMPDGKTIETKRGDLVRVFSLKGAELQVTNEEAHKALFYARRTWLNQLAEKGARVRLFTLRQMAEPHSPLPHPVPHLATLAEKWESSFEGNSFFTHHYAIVSVPKEGAKKVIEEVTRITLTTMYNFGAQLLDYTTSESPLKLLGRLASPLSRPNPAPVPHAYVPDQITSDSIHFADNDTGLITISSGDRKRYAAVLGMKVLGDAAEEQMMAELATLKFEYTLFHNIEPLSRIKSKQSLELRGRLARTTFASGTAVEQFAIADAIVSGNEDAAQILCNYAFTIIVEADSEEELDQRISRISMITSAYQVTMVREGAISHATWWSMFPTYDLMARPWLLSASNVATNLAMQENNPGSTFSPWGKTPITVLRTATGNPYNFVFQDMSDPNNKEPLAHMLLIGPPGSGKTVFATWISTMALRHPELYVFLFDRSNGTEVVTNLSDGRYVFFDGSDAAMNPLQMELTPQNKSFLRNWLQQLTGLHDEESVQEFANAIEMLENVPLEQRNLKHLQQVGFNKDSETRARIRPWTNDAAYGQYFCAPRDNLDLDGRLIGFDFTDVLDPMRQDNLGPAVVEYIMHRTREITRERDRPAIYFVDETAPLLKNKTFAEKFLVGLREGRKNQQVFICAFQTPDAIIASGHHETIIGNCATQVFFRNPKLTEENYAIFGMTKRELDFVLGKSHQHLRRAFMLRRQSEGKGWESIIIDGDMSALGDGLTTYASGIPYVKLLQRARAENPQGWKQRYLEEAARFRNE